MNKRRSYAAIAALLILSLVGCTPSQVVSDLQIALDAITVALPVLGTLTGVPADVVTAVISYSAATNQALGQAATILDGPGTDAEKAAAIAAAFAGIATPLVPAQYTALATLVGTIAGDVAVFLASVPALGTQMAREAAAKSPHATKWSMDERIKLSRAHNVASDNAAKLAKIKR